MPATATWNRLQSLHSPCGNLALLSQKHTLELSSDPLSYIVYIVHIQFILYYSILIYVLCTCSCSRVKCMLVTFYTDRLNCPSAIIWAHQVTQHEDNEPSDGGLDEMVWPISRKIHLFRFPGLPPTNQARKVMSYPKRMTDTFWPWKLNFLSFSALRAPKLYSNIFYASISLQIISEDVLLKDF